MCHQTVRPTPAGQSPAPGDDGPAPLGHLGAEPVAQEGEQDLEKPSDEGNLGLARQQPEKESESEDRPSEPESVVVRDLAFGSDGELDVRFSSQNRLGRTSENCCSPFEVNGPDSSLRTDLGAVSETQTASELTGLHGFAFHPNHDRTSKSSHSLHSHEGNVSDENQKLVSGGASPVGAQTSLESCNQNSADSVNSRHGFSTHSNVILKAPSSGTTDSQATAADCAPYVP